MSFCSRGHQWCGTSELCWTSVLGRGVGEGRREKDRGMGGKERVMVRGRNVNEKRAREWRSGLKMGRRMARKSNTERKDSLLCSFP